MRRKPRITKRERKYNEYLAAVEKSYEEPRRLPESIRAKIAELTARAQQHYMRLGTTSSGKIAIDVETTGLSHAVYVEK